MSALEDQLDELTRRQGLGWSVMEDWRPGPISPLLRLQADGTVEKLDSGARWWSACAFEQATKDILAVTDEVHGEEAARDVVLQQLIERLAASSP